MNTFINILTTALISIFIQNSIFDRALGSNVLLYAARKKEHLLGFAAGITYITALAAIPVYYLDRLFAGFEYYSIIMPFMYILAVGIIYCVTLIAIWRFFPKLFSKIKKYVHLSVFNCSVLGALFLASQYGSDLGSYIGYGIGTGIGFLLAAYLLYIAADRLNSELVPACFRGMPVMIVYVGILSLAFYAFMGYTTAI